MILELTEIMWNWDISNALRSMLKNETKYVALWNKVNRIMKQNIIRTSIDIGIKIHIKTKNSELTFWVRFYSFYKLYTIQIITYK